MKEVDFTVKKLYVGNLPYEYDSHALEDLFSKYGTVESAMVITDRNSGRSKGFGFVELDDEAAKKASSELDGKEVDGRTLKVNEAKPMERQNRGFRR
jgi:RNA recognition motif-containing protein